MATPKPEHAAARVPAGGKNGTAQAGDADDIAEQALAGAGAADGMLGINPLLGLQPQDVGAICEHLTTAATTQAAAGLDPYELFLRSTTSALGEVGSLTPAPGDKRFQDPAWQTHPLYRMLLQLYLAWSKSAYSIIDSVQLSEKDRARARFLMMQVIEAFAPTNTPWGNPVVMRKFFETGGASLMRGLQNFLDDQTHNGGMPAQVDKRAFTPGKNLGITPGAVVFKNDLLELIQYAPQRAQVYQRPLLVVPPQINKFYILDLAPGRSFFEWALQQGIQTFTISWRNPQPEHGAWNLETYIRALREALDATCAITGSDDVHLAGMCAGGLTSIMLLASLAAQGARQVHTATLLVTALIDASTDSQVGLFTTEHTIALAQQSSATQGILPGEELRRTFTWLRPNDLVWNYWVNNYLLGQDPPAFDILYWNSDSTNLAAGLHHDFLEMARRNPLKYPGTFTLLGRPLDVRTIAIETYILAGMTDHITPWKDCYTTAQFLGGRHEFVLNASGHIQSVVNPPGNPKARFFTNPQAPTDPEQWLAEATAHAGSWWDHWHDWITPRSGQLQPAPAALGNQRYPPGVPAPGTYITEALKSTEALKH